MIASVYAFDCLCRSGVSRVPSGNRTTENGDTVLPKSRRPDSLPMNESRSASHDRDKKRNSVKFKIVPNNGTRPRASLTADLVLPGFGNPSLARYASPMRKSTLELWLRMIKVDLFGGMGSPYALNFMLDQRSRAKVDKRKNA